MTLRLPGLAPALLALLAPAELASAVTAQDCVFLPAPRAQQQGLVRPGPARATSSPPDAPALRGGAPAADPGSAGTAAHVGGPHGPPRRALATTGTLENLVLVVRFSDHGPDGQDRTLPSAADYDALLNAVGGDPLLAPTGSVRDYFLEASYGLLAVESTVVAWIDLPQSETYYSDGTYGLTPVFHEAVVAALDAADPLVDFLDFDVDGDGWIDAITLLHSGYGAEWGGVDAYGTDYADRIWSHKWTIPTWTSDEGVRVADYNVSAGLWDTSGSDPTRIGVVCHELAHFLGLPDLYDTDGSGVGLGDWGLMGSGAWGFDDSQQYPSHPCAWSKTKLGWVTPQRLLPGTYAAPQVETDPVVYLVDSGYPAGEYLLIENRQPVGFDALLPQGGLAIWHVDEGKGSLAWNSVNQDEGYPGQPGWPENGRHHRVALLQADGSYDLELWANRGDATDLWHAGGAPVLDATTTPNTHAYQGGDILVNENRFEAIGPAAASMSFTYVNDAAPVVTGVLAPVAYVGLPFTATLTSAGGAGPFTWSEYLQEAEYVVTDLGPQPFELGGVPLGVTADELTWSHDLPFAFPFFQESYPRVHLTDNGTVDLAPLQGEFLNRTPFLRLLPRIAGLWDDLLLLALDDVWVTESPTAVRFRWDATNAATGDPVHAAVTLHADGRIRLDYGPDNTDLTPSVGISRGEGGALVLVDSHDGESELTLASSVELELVGSQLPPGLSIAMDGTLAGTPTTVGVFEFHVRVTDGLHRYARAVASVEVHAASIPPVVRPARPLVPVARPWSLATR